MGVATDVSENYLDCLDVPAEYQPSTYVSDTHRAIIFQSIDYLCQTYRSVSTCFCIFFFPPPSSFFLPLFSPDETRVRELVRVYVNVEDCFLSRICRRKRRTFVRLGGKRCSEKNDTHGSTLLKFDRELSILANSAGDELSSFNSLLIPSLN